LAKAGGINGKLKKRSKIAALQEPRAKTLMMDIWAKALVSKYPQILRLQAEAIHNSVLKFYFHQ